MINTIRKIAKIKIPWGPSGCAIHFDLSLSIAGESVKITDNEKHTFFFRSWLSGHPYECPDTHMFRKANHLKEMFLILYIHISKLHKSMYFDGFHDPVIISKLVRRRAHKNVF